MAKQKLFNIIIKKGTYDILSADTGFYAFMDDSRLYYTFDRLIYEPDKWEFTRRAEALDTGNFILRMVEVDESINSFYVIMKEGVLENQIQITLIDIGGLFTSQKELESNELIQNKLLELYGDDFFIYNPQTDRIKIIYDYNIAAKETDISLDAFEALLKKYVSDSKYEEIDELISNIRDGKRYFESIVERKFDTDNQELEHGYIKGAAVYENGDRILSTGFIRKNIGKAMEYTKNKEVDSFTGLLAKGEITNMAIREIDVDKRQNISIAIIDVDYFKKINDTFGHMMGDKVIKKVANIIKEEVGDKGVVGRIGGDEFFVIFYDIYDMEYARERLRSIKNTVCAVFPANSDDMPVVTLSIGCAAYPKDASTYVDLFDLADFSLYMAKEKGRNRYIIYNKNIHGDITEIQKKMHQSARINNRGDMSKSDMLCLMMDNVYTNKNYTVERLLDDINANFESQRIMVYDMEHTKVLHMVGTQVPDRELADATSQYIHSSFIEGEMVNDCLVINDIKMVQNRDEEAYNMMQSQGIRSFIHIRFKDKNGLKCVLSLESVTKKITWDGDHKHYYRIMARLLSEYRFN